jgi:hypothetical protein
MPLGENTVKSAFFTPNDCICRKGDPSGLVGMSAVSVEVLASFLNCAGVFEGARGRAEGGCWNDSSGGIKRGRASEAVSLRSRRVD